MKKTYINPTVEVIKIASQMQMLTGSEVVTLSDDRRDPGNAAGRGFDFDDEEEY